MPFCRSEHPRRPIVPPRRSEDEVHANLLEDQFEIAAGVSSPPGTKCEFCLVLLMAAIGTFFT
jgi:hypothetical protein